MMHNLAQDENDSYSSGYDSSSASPHSSTTTSSKSTTCNPQQQLQHMITSTAAAADTDTTTELGVSHERQTLLLMLLGQVCSLHDATPRTFVVHVIALYERGILDSNSISFLFELGLVPRGYDLNQIGSTSGGDGSTNINIDIGGEVYQEAEDSDDDDDDATTSSERDVDADRAQTSTGTDHGNGNVSHQEQGAIVPYCEQANQHPWAPLLVSSKSKQNSNSNGNSNNNNLQAKNMAHRQKEASAIRKHLERHESIDSTGSIFGSAAAVSTAMPGTGIRTTRTSSVTSASVSTSSNTNNNASSSYPDFSKRWNRATSSATRNSLTSAEESFDNPSLRPYHHNMQNHDNTTMRNENDGNGIGMPNNTNAPTHTTQQLTTHMPPIASWSVEHHPLSLSRYQREFHQLSLLATGSFGSVYHAIHKLEQRPYAVKCVTFSTMGYYANTLALVIREVRCLAQLDHPNCVRYYTSWLEPSWMTGDQQASFVNEEDDEHDDDEYDVTNHTHTPPNKKGSPKLLTDIERVIGGLHDTNEIGDSMEQLEAILYGGNDNDDDGFNWASSSQATAQHSAFSSGRTEQKETIDDDDWDNLPSHRTAGGESDVSEWTQDLNNSSGGNSSGQTKSFHNSQQSYQRHESLELVPAGGVDTNSNVNGHTNPQYERQNSTSSASATYKYQISLYIQMQLCNPSTLADYIKQRNASCIDFDAEERQARARPAFEIFRQIVNGLVHVHAKGIVHRDLKPANIFAGDDGSFMIGDFGLSKMMKDANNTHGVDIDNAIILPKGYSSGIHTAGVGTVSYASPEQITTKTYGTPADIFSLGLILLELFSNFTSEHERAKAFHDCRHDRELAPWVKRYYPEVSALVLACTQADWSRRPSASDIQAADVFQERGNGIEIFRAELRALKADMARKDQLIQRQTEQLSKKDGVIEDLRRRLSAMEAKKDGEGLKSETGTDSVVDIDDFSSSSSSSDGDY